MEIKPLFLACCKFDVGNEKRTRFWEDSWLSDTSLSLQFSLLFGISNDQNILVSTVFESGLNSLSFWRNLMGDKLVDWRKLVSCCADVRLSEVDDKMVWLLSASKKFSVKSFYSAMQTMEKVPFNFWWKFKMPLRIKTFIWLILKKVFSLGMFCWIEVGLVQKVVFSVDKMKALTTSS